MGQQKSKLGEDQADERNHQGHIKRRKKPSSASSSSSGSTWRKKRGYSLPPQPQNEAVAETENGRQSAVLLAYNKFQAEDDEILRGKSRKISRSQSFAVVPEAKTFEDGSKIKESIKVESLEGEDRDENEEERAKCRKISRSRSCAVIPETTENIIEISRCEEVLVCSGPDESSSSSSSRTARDEENAVQVLNINAEEDEEEEEEDKKSSSSDEGSCKIPLPATSVDFDCFDLAPPPPPPRVESTSDDLLSHREKEEYLNEAPAAAVVIDNEDDCLVPSSCSTASFSAEDERRTKDDFSELETGEKTFREWNNSISNDELEEEEFVSRRLPPLGCSSDDLDSVDSLEPADQTALLRKKRELPKIPLDLEQRKRASKILSDFCHQQQQQQPGNERDYFSADGRSRNTPVREIAKKRLLPAVPDHRPPSSLSPKPDSGCFSAPDVGPKEEQRVGNYLWVGLDNDCDKPKKRLPKNHERLLRTSERNDSGWQPNLSPFSRLSKFLFL